MGASRGGPWILVVDDNTALRHVWLDVLAEEGYTAVGAADGLEAAELVHDLRPDLILLDLQMPRLRMGFPRELAVSTTGAPDPDRHPLRACW